MREITKVRKENINYSITKNITELIIDFYSMQILYDKFKSSSDLYDKYRISFHNSFDKNLYLLKHHLFFQISISLLQKEYDMLRNEIADIKRNNSRDELYYFFKVPQLTNMTKFNNSIEDKLQEFLNINYSFYSINNKTNTNYTIKELLNNLTNKANVQLFSMINNLLDITNINILNIQIDKLLNIIQFSNLTEYFILKTEKENLYLDEILDKSIDGNENVLVLNKDYTLRQYINNFLI